MKFFFCCRYIRDGFGRRRRQVGFQSELPLHVSGEERERRQQRCQGAAPGAGSRDPLNLAASLLLLQCLRALRRGAPRHNEGKQPEMALVLCSAWHRRVQESA